MPLIRIRSGKEKSTVINEPIIKEFRTIEGHKCSLPIAEDALSTYLYDGPFVLFRRKFKKIFLISEHFPKTKYYFRSSLRIGMENRRHLRNFYYTIHPFSKFRFYWEILIGFVFLALIIYVPFYSMNYENPENSAWDDVYYMFLNSICGVDMLITFLTGYVDKKTETVILNLKYAFKRYIFTYFFFDVAAAFPTSTACSTLGIPVVHWIILNRYVRIVRINTSLRYLENLMDVINMDSKMKTLISRTLFVIIFLEYSTSITFFDRLWFIEEFELWPEIEKIFMMLIFTTLRTVCLVRPHIYKHYRNNILLLLHQCILLHCGNILNALLITKFYALYNRTNQILRKNENITQQVKEYAGFKGLSESTHQMLLQYVNFKFGKRIYNEDLILETLTPHLRDELFFLYSQKLMENVELLKDLPIIAVKRIAAKLKQEIVIPNNVIIQAGQEGSSMYFILTGVVAVYTIGGKEVCHLTDGANFGEIALLMNETRTASIVAVDFCEVFKLRRKDFQAAIDPFPELKEKLVQTARERYTTLISFPENEDDVTLVSEIN